MRRTKNTSLVIFIYITILMCMFIWLTSTFERKQKQPLREDIKKELWRQIGLLEKVCKSTDDINQICDIGRPHLFHLRFVGKPGIPIMAEVLTDKNRDWKLRCLLAQLMSNMESESVIPILKGIVDDETDNKRVRIVSTIVLSNLNFDEATDILLEVAQGKDKELQIAAIYALGELKKKKLEELKKKEIVDKLKKWLVNEEDLQIKEELRLALEKYKVEN